MQEIWSDYPGDRRYEVSTLGNFRNRTTKRQIKRNKRGVITLSPTGEPSKSVMPGRAVAAAFLGFQLTEDRRIVYRDGNRMNARLDNLSLETPACKQGHLLVAPNLGPRRSCKTCNYARSMINFDPDKVVDYYERMGLREENT